MIHGRRAFTMVELVFVIVILGILSAVAIPKLAATRTDAHASVCVHEAGQLLSEISANYTKMGFDKFKNTPIQDITYIRVQTAGSEGNYVQKDDIVHLTGADYYCDGEPVINYTAKKSGNVYQLIVTPAENPASPVAASAVKQIKKNITDGANKIFVLF